jgi:hypothetical protein
MMTTLRHDLGAYLFTGERARDRHFDPLASRTPRTIRSESLDLKSMRLVSHYRHRYKLAETIGFVSTPRSHA